MTKVSLDLSAFKLDDHESLSEMSKMFLLVAYSADSIEPAWIYTGQNCLMNLLS